MKLGDAAAETARPSSLAVWWRNHFDLGNLILLLAILIGALMGLMGHVMHLMLHNVGDAAIFLYSVGKTVLSRRVILFLLPLAGVLLSFLVQRFLCGRRFSKSLSPLILALDKQQETIPFSETVTHIISSTLSVGFGGSAGLEAPSVLTGAAIGSNVARVCGLDRLPRSLLVGCGGAAAISAIFDSPIGGVLFVVEALLPEFSMSALIPLLLSSAVSSVVSQFLSGKHVFFMATLAPWNRSAILPIFLCGVVCALVGVFIIRSHYWLSGALKRQGNPYLRLLLGGGVLCLLLFLFPIVRSQGYAGIEGLLLEDVHNVTLFPPGYWEWLPPAAVPAVMLAAAVFLKPLVSSLTIESGGDGGMFAPTMFIGAFTGFAFARFLNHFAIVSVSEANFAVLGMCGVFTAVMRAPLTGVFLIAETTAGFSLMVPLMIVSAISWALGKIFEPQSIYRKSLIAAHQVSEGHDQHVLCRVKVAECQEEVPLQLSPGIHITEVVELVENMDLENPAFPVVDESGRLIGVLPAEKFLTAVLDHTHSLKVAELMDPPLGCVTPDEDLSQALQKMERHDLKILPVTDAGGHFLGFLTKEALFAKYRSEEDPE
ncbi:MAG: chloride channel protein [Victivallales bacterium]|nr:chloride channel protein [Victivallales bacterium]